MPPSPSAGGPAPRPASLPQLPSELAWGLLASVGGATAIKDDHLRYAWVNSAFCRLFDLEESAVIGKTDDEIFLNGPRVPDPLAEQNVLASGGSSERYETIFLASGELRELLASIGSATADNRRWLILMFHDITEVTVANHSLVRTTEALTATAIKLRAQAMLDPLTGLLNRRGFDEVVPKSFAAHHYSGGLLMLDIDNFKQTNDAHGHETGDAILTTIAETIRSGTRYGSDIVARFGGDEFIIAMPGSSRNEIDSVAERIRSGVVKRARPSGTSIHTTVTIGGIHRLPGPPIGLDVLRRAADKLLYEAKQAGRNRVLVDTITDVPVDV